MNLMQINKRNGRRIADFLFEAGMLKNTKRTGWGTVRAPEESVAEHSFRAAIVGWVLAKMAGLDEREEALLIKACLFHDLHEARLGDLHRMAKLYGSLDEKRAEEDQRKGLPDKMSKDLQQALERLPSRIRTFALDADKLECAITAKEYLDAGFRTKKWIEHTRPALLTKEAKKLLSIIEKSDSISWIVDYKDYKK